MQTCFAQRLIASTNRLAASLADHRHQSVAFHSAPPGAELLMLGDIEQRQQFIEHFGDSP